MRATSAAGAAGWRMASTSRRRGRNRAVKSSRPERDVETVSTLEKGFRRERTLGERLAEVSVRGAGSLPFVGAHVLWFAAWLGVNLNLVPGVSAFDPFPFPFLTLVVSLEAIFLALLACATLAEAIGIHALFGAFLFGVIVPRQGRMVAGLVDRVDDLVVVLFLPLFFAFTGLRTQIGLVSGAELWGWCGVVMLVATAGKLLGTAVPARLGGLDWRASATIGGKCRFMSR